MSSGKNLMLYLTGFLCLCTATGGVVFIAHTRNRAEASEAEQRRTEVAAGPHVLVAAAKAAPTERQLDLQAEARPFAEVTLYAKISGYLRSIYVDKGDVVRANQLLAVIETPELDRQYDAAVADAKFKRANADRSQSLVKPGFIAPRDAEQDTSLAVMAEATMASLSTQKAYEQLHAPFAGTITARFIDPGALVQSAVNAQTGAQPVVTISQVERLRVYAYVNQRDAAEVRVGSPVDISVPGAPVEDTVHAQVTRLANELDPRTRMMLIEVDIDNKAGRIVPGSFVNAALSIRTPPAVEIPAEALIVRGNKTLVARVHGKDDPRVSFQPVSVRSSDGARIAVASGLQVGDFVALNLGDTVPEGAQIQPIWPAQLAAR